MATHQRRRWHSTPVLLPGKSHGWRSQVTLFSIKDASEERLWVSSASPFLLPTHSASNSGIFLRPPSPGILPQFWRKHTRPMSCRLFSRIFLTLCSKQRCYVLQIFQRLQGRMRDSPATCLSLCPSPRNCTLLECDHFSEMPPIGVESWSSEMGRLLVPRTSFIVSLPSSDSLPSLGVPACYDVLLDSSMSE